jgi:hypothetical protein
MHQIVGLANGVIEEILLGDNAYQVKQFCMGIVAGDELWPSQLLTAGLLQETKNDVPNSGIKRSGIPLCFYVTTLAEWKVFIFVRNLDTNITRVYSKYVRLDAKEQPKSIRIPPSFFLGDINTSVIMFFGRYSILEYDQIVKLLRVGHPSLKFLVRSRFVPKALDRDAMVIEADKLQLVCSIFSAIEGNYATPEDKLREISTARQRRVIRR